MFGTDNNIFDNSFVYNTNYDKQFICGIGYYVYDKTVEKLIYWPSGGCTAGIADKTYVLSEEKLNDELKVQIESLNQIIALQKEQINILNSANTSYQDLIQIQKEGYEKEIKNARPSILQEILKGAGYIGLGILIGAFAL